MFNDVDGQTAAERQIGSLKESTYEPKSNRNVGYNCFAWALRDSENIVEPPGTASWARWRDDLPEWITLTNYRRFYELEGGFEGCQDGSHEPGYEKIAIFTDDHDVPMHAARQLPCGRWTSKLGRGIDIEHDLDTLEGEPTMGKVALFMKRSCPGPPPEPPGGVIVVTEMPELPPLSH